MWIITGLLCFAHISQIGSNRLSSAWMRAVGVLQVESEHLVNLQSNGAGLKRPLELRSRLGRPSGIVDALEVQPRELYDAVAEGAADLHAGIEAGAVSTVHVGDDADARLIHEPISF